jgi:hypothetical protein
LKIFLWINPTDVLLFEGLIIWFKFATTRQLQSLYLILLFRLPRCICVLLCPNLQRSFISILNRLNFFHLNWLSILIILIIVMMMHGILLTLFLRLYCINILFWIFIVFIIPLIARWVEYYNRLLRIRWIASIVLILNCF